MMIMSDFTLLKQLLNGDALVPVHNRQAKLKEQESGSSYVVYLKGLPDNTLILKADLFPSPEKILNCGDREGICKRADYVVVNEKEMIFIELKKSKSGSEKIKQQLRGARCVMDYCIAIGQQFFSRPRFLQKAIKKTHFVSIRWININKQNPKQSATASCNDTPERMSQLKGESFQYKKLLG